MCLQRNFLKLYFNYYIFLYKYRVFIFFRFFKNSLNKKLKFLTFFKKKNVFFKSNEKMNKKIKNKLLSLKGRLRKKPGNFSNVSNEKVLSFFDRKKNAFHKPSPKLYTFFFKTDFSLKLKKNVNFLKIFFLRNKVLRKKIRNFFKNISQNSNIFFKNFDSILYLTLIKAHFIFFCLDAKFFLKKGLVFVNGVVEKNHMTVLNCGDRVQLPFSKFYFIYIKCCKKFFKKKLKYIRYKRWKSFKNRSMQKFIRWNPDFLKRFIAFKIDIPFCFEVDFLTLTYIILKKNPEIFKKNSLFNKFLSFFLLKSYNWKRIT